MIDESILVEKIAEAIWNSGYDNNPDAWKYFVMHADKEDSNTIKEVRKEAQAALSIIQPELDKRDEALECIDIQAQVMLRASNLDYQARKDIEAIQQIASTALKTTTGHDLNNHKPQGELK